ERDRMLRALLRGRQFPLAAGPPAGAPALQAPGKRLRACPKILRGASRASVLFVAFVLCVVSVASDARPGSDKERVMRFLLRDRRERAVTRTKQCVLRQGENLRADAFLEELPGLEPAGDGTREDRVPDDCDCRRVLRPGADDVGDSFFGVAGRF